MLYGILIKNEYKVPMPDLLLSVFKLPTHLGPEEFASYLKNYDVPLEIKDEGVEVRTLRSEEAAKYWMSEIFPIKIDPSTLWDMFDQLDFDYVIRKFNETSKTHTFHLFSDIAEAVQFLYKQ